MLNTLRRMEAVYLLRKKSLQKLYASKMYRLIQSCGMKGELEKLTLIYKGLGNDINVKLSNSNYDKRTVGHLVSFPK